MPAAAPDLRTLDLRVDGAVASLALNRPERLNAMSALLLADLVEAALWLDGAREVKVVIVRGVGRAFCAGFDLHTMLEDAATPEGARRVAGLGRTMTEAIAGMRAVTVAAVQGHCVGGGVALAASCDIRLAAADAQFSIPEVDLGIPLAWGAVPRLVAEIGPAATRDLVMTCRRIGAAEARDLGLVQEVTPEGELSARAAALAGSLAAKSALTLETTKRQVSAAAYGAGAIENDADLIAAAVADPESRAVAERYLAGRLRRT